MNEDLQQLALLDTLIGNWDSVQIRLGDSAPALQASLAAIAGRLAATADADAVALILDDLLDLLEGTPAYAFVRELIVRSQVAPGRTRALGSAGAICAPPAIAEAAALVGDGSARLATAIAAQAEPCMIQLYFATNRCVASAGDARFTADPSGQLAYGLARVTIPIDRHRLGHVEQRAWWKVLGDRNDERRYVVLGEVEALSGGAFVSRLEGDPEAAKGLLVFTHGYNVSFEEAARRAAQLAFDLNFRGRVVLFSWPSCGSLLGYGADEERALLSAHEFRGFLESLAGGPWSQVHLLAHSMGNRVLLHGLAGDVWPNRKLAQVVFVAADVYVDLFRQQFPRIRDAGANYSSYASQRDRALFFSALLHRADRVGAIDGTPFITDGLETIDATAVDTSVLGLGLGHSYFADQRSLLTDIGILVGAGLPASQRGLAQSDRPRHWYFPR
jgi:esterase/lipase superfamily enzyme